MSEINFNKLITDLSTKGIKCFGLYQFGLICLYDDDLYSNIDYDFVSNKDREIIRLILKNLSWKQKSGRVFVKESFQLTFPRPSPTLGADPSDPVVSELNKNTYVFCTPTQALLTMSRKGSWNQDTAKKMIDKCPANIDKIYQWLKEYNMTVPSKENLEELKKIQRISFDKKVSARKKDLL